GEPCALSAVPGTRPLPCCATHGQGVDEEFGPDAARLEHVPEIGGEAVAEIDHGVRQEGFREPAGFRETWLEVEVATRHGSAEGAGDEDRVARAGAGAPDNPLPRHGADGGYGQERAARRDRGLPSDDGDLPARRQRLESLIDGI